MHAAHKQEGEGGFVFRSFFGRWMGKWVDGWMGR